jgi:hypothetical protein
MSEIRVQSLLHPGTMHRKSRLSIVRKLICLISRLGSIGVGILFELFPGKGDEGDDDELEPLFEGLRADVLDAWGLEEPPGYEYSTISTKTDRLSL